MKHTARHAIHSRADQNHARAGESRGDSAQGKAQEEMWRVRAHTASRTPRGTHCVSHTAGQCHPSADQWLQTQTDRQIRAIILRGKAIEELRKSRGERVGVEVLRILYMSIWAVLGSVACKGRRRLHPRFFVAVQGAVRLYLGGEERVFCVLFHVTRLSQGGSGSARLMCVVQVLIEFCLNTTVECV